jgi:hypothetical protein
MSLIVEQYVEREVCKLDLSKIRLSYNLIFGRLFIIVFLAIFSLFITNEIRLPIITAILLGIIILLYINTKTLITKLIAFIYYGILLVLVNFNIVLFNFIPQAKALLDSNNNLIYWFYSGHPHSVRLLVAYPGYILSKLLDISLDQGFTYYGTLLFMLLYLVLTNIYDKLQHAKNILPSYVKYILMLIPLGILPLIMNGRMLLAFLGYALLINFLVDFYKGNNKVTIILLFKIFISLILTMVSSGAMTVAILFLISMVYSINSKNILNKKFIKKAVVLLIVLAPIINKLFNYFLLMLNRNIIYFGGGFQGFVNMLNHGLGRIFMLKKFILVLAAIIGSLILIINIRIILKKIKSEDNDLPLILAINIAAYGILFGFSTGLMMIPPLIILILIRI